MTKLEAAKLVTSLMAFFPREQFPPGTVAGYEHFIGELEFDRARQAVENVIRTSEFLPTIAKILTAYDSLAPRKPDSGYRLFRPKPVERAMEPGELKDAIAKALEAMK